MERSTALFSTSKHREPWTLVILAAGLGSRFGGDKQLAKFSSAQVTLMELNIIAAFHHGARQVVFVVNENVQNYIEQFISSTLPKEIDVVYVQQHSNDLPSNSQQPLRTKPWGTAHALWCCRHAVDSAFVVINADDFYGEQAFSIASEHIEKQNQWAMIGYSLQSTLSEHGGVNRGLCEVNNANELTKIEEVTNIRLRGKQYENNNQLQLSAKSIVSMNCWLFQPDVFNYLTSYLTEFIAQHKHELTSECYLPAFVLATINAERKKVNVYQSDDNWFGLTYREDCHIVEQAVGIKIQTTPFNWFLAQARK